MTTTAAPAPAPVFVPIVPAHLFDAMYGRMPLAVPGADLWWDDASYIRYQSADPEFVPEHISGAEIASADYCDGRTRPACCGGTEYVMCGDPHCLVCPPF